MSADQRVLCGASRITQDRCLAKGCCFDAKTSVCFYPMDGMSSSTSENAYSRNLSQVNSHSMQFLGRSS